MKFIALFFILLAGAASAADRLVTSKLDSGPGTLRTVIAAASNGDRIVFDPSLAGQTIVLTSGPISPGRPLTIDGSGLSSAVTVSGNKASSIFSVSTTTTLDSLVLRDGKGSYGGAIGSSSQLTVRRCLFLQNQASYEGGAIYHGTSSQLLLQNSTFNANTAQSGGAISCQGTMELRSCTIVGNTATGTGAGSGIYAIQPFTCRESVIAGNGVVNGVDLPSANIYPSNYHSPTGASAGNFIGGDPALFPLGSYGGPTPTMLPLSGSPLIDPTANASTSPLATDQRGSVRVTGPRVDTGAVEWNSTSTFVSPPDGFVSASLGSQAVMWSMGQVGDSFEVFLGSVSGQLAKVGTTTVGRFNLLLTQSGSTYYWRIDTIRGDTRITGEERSLTTRSPITVTTLGDENDGSPDPAIGTGTSLREAILAANAAEGGDRIEFSAALAGGTIVLGGTQLVATGSLEIDASALSARLVVSADHRSSIFAGFAEGGESPRFALANLKLTRGKSIGTQQNISAVGELVLNRCEISGNDADTIAGVAGATVEISNCVIDSNTSTKTSGCYILATDLALRNSSVTGNFGTNACVSVSNSGILENVTISDNTGHGIAKTGSGELVIRHATVTRNRSSTTAGLRILGPGAVKVENSIIAGNITYSRLSSTQADVQGTPVLSGTNFVGGNPLLAPLGYYGGPSKTSPPVIGSPVVDPAGGASSSNLATDQRGYPRVLNGVADIGAVEFGSAPGVAPADNAADVSSYLPALYWMSPAAATYTVYFGTAPGALALLGTTSVGRWDLGILEPETTYYWRVDATVDGILVAGEVHSFATRPALQVTTLVDEDDGTPDSAVGSGTSLREALAAANFTLDRDTIRFAPALAGGTIVLAGTTVVVSDGVLIDALNLPGGLTISGNRQSGTLSLPQRMEAGIQGLTLRDSPGAGLVNAGNLAVKRCKITANRGSGVKSDEGSLTMEECLILGNRASSDSGGIESTGSVVLRRCTIADNYGNSYAAIHHRSGPLTLEQCTLATNPTNTYHSYNIDCIGGDVILRECTLIGIVSVNSARLTVENSIVASSDPGQNPISAGDLVQLGRNFTSGDPLLAPLGDYGGSVPTMPPVAGSPAIDPVAGANSSSFASDQRGHTRLYGAKVDTGAVEYSADLASFPADGATGIASYRLPLCWPGVAGASSYQVLLAAEGSPLAAAGTTGTGIWTTGQLQPDRTYHWRVDATVGAAVVSGPEWSFTTRPALSVTTLADEDDPPLVPGTGLSLREALGAAALSFGGDVIRFAPALDAGKVRLGGSKLLLNDTCAIDGSQLPHGITISGNQESSVAEVPFEGDVAITCCAVRDGVDTGIRNFGRLSLDRCSVVYNRGSSDGGGIYNKGDLRVANSTIAENSADFGGGIYNEGAMELRNTTVSANQAGIYGYAGIKDVYGGYRLVSCIVAGNRRGENMTRTTGFLEGVNFLNGDPHLASLGDYGGPTLTMPPLAGSPVIDPAGNGAGSSLATDQRGGPRIVGSLLDSGAVEWSAAPLWSPADGASGLPVPQVILNWNAQPGQQSHQILLGTSPDHLAPVGTATWGSFTLEGLLPATTYYWRIDSTSGGLFTPGTVRHFTTRPALVVTTAQDETDPSPASGTSLAEALIAASHADGADWIVFAPALSGATITMQDYRTVTVDSDLGIDASALAVPPLITGKGDYGVLVVKPYLSARLVGFAITGTSPAKIKCSNCDLLVDGMEIFGNNTGISADSCNLRISNSTLHHNNGYFGGGLAAKYGSLEVVNSTFTANTAEWGGGVYMSSVPSPLFRHVTIAGNNAKKSGGIFVDTKLDLQASVLAGNTDLQGLPDSDLSQSLVNSSVVGVNPRLAPLDLYGGRVPIMPLLPGSPAIDLVPGASANPPLDQRGATRPLGPAADAGAVEAFPFVSLQKVDTDSDGIDDRLEPALGFVVGQNDSGVDRDGDGRSDAAELDAMTDPTDANDFLRITSFDAGAGERVIHFRSFPGVSYRLARSANLSLFTPVPGTTMTATGRSSSMVVPDDPGRAFFRVEVSTPVGP